MCLHGGCLNLYNLSFVLKDIYLICGYYFDIDTCELPCLQSLKLNYKYVLTLLDIITLLEQQIITIIDDEVIEIF